MNIRDLLTYDSGSGILRWKACQAMSLAWNRRWSGKVAGAYKMQNGSHKKAGVMIKHNGRTLSAHRIIWEMIKGSIPEGFEIDHIDRDPWNNRVSNLRLATPSQNGCNKTMQSNNTTGYKGVSRFNHKWYRATISFNKKQRTIGYYDTPEKAYEAYCMAAKELHGEFVCYGLGEVEGITREYFGNVIKTKAA